MRAPLSADRRSRGTSRALVVRLGVNTDSVRTISPLSACSERTPRPARGSCSVRHGTRRREPSSRADSRPTPVRSIIRRRPRLRLPFPTDSVRRHQSALRWALRCERRGHCPCLHVLKCQINQSSTLGNQAVPMAYWIASDQPEAQDGVGVCTVQTDILVDSLERRCLGRIGPDTVASFAVPEFVPQKDTVPHDERAARSGRKDSANAAEIRRGLALEAVMAAGWRRLPVEGDFPIMAGDP